MLADYKILGDITVAVWLTRRYPTWYVHLVELFVSGMIRYAIPFILWFGDNLTRILFRDQKTGLSGVFRLCWVGGSNGISRSNKDWTRKSLRYQFVFSVKFRLASASSPSTSKITQFRCPGQYTAHYSSTPCRLHISRPKWSSRTRFHGREHSIL